MTPTMTKKEVAEFLGYKSTKTIDRKVKAGYLTPLYPPSGAGHVRFSKEEAANFFSQKNKI